MKKLMVLVSALALVLGCTACGNPNSTSTSTGVNESTAIISDVNIDSIKDTVYTIENYGDGPDTSYFYISANGTKYVVAHGNVQTVTDEIKDVSGTKYVLRGGIWTRGSGSGLFTSWYDGDCLIVTLYSNGSFLTASGGTGTFTNNSGIINTFVAGNFGQTVLYNGERLYSSFKLIQVTNTATIQQVKTQCNSAS